MTAASPYQDLKLDQWRRLLAHAALLRASTPRLSELYSLSLQFELLRGVLTDLALAAARASRSAKNDGQVVRKAAALWCQDLDRQLADAGIAQGHRTLLQEVRGYALGATPADPFRVFFDSVTRVSADAYADCWIRPSLSVQWMPRHPRGAGPEDPYAITARTRQAQAPIVELCIHTEGFGPPAYSVIPSLMFHECICHVPAVHRGNNNKSPFAEGFMDFAARFFFDMWISRLDAALAPTARQHEGRLDHFLIQPATDEGAARRYGRNAAEVVATWLETSHGLTRPEAEAWVANLAIELNCTTSPLGVKDALVARLNSVWSATLENQLNDVFDRRTPAANLL